MRRLAVTLVLAVLAATVGAGWFIDRLFERIESSESTPLAAWRELGRAVAELADRVEEPEVALAELAEKHGLAIEWLPREALGAGGAVDDALEEALAGPDGLALESEAGIDVYYALERHEALLGISRIEPDVLAPWLRVLLTLAFYAVVLALVLLWLKPLLARLAALDAAARDFGHGRLERRVPARSGDELARLERSFNHMAARIESLIEDNRLLSSAVSHDLRTPLARLRFGIDALAELERTAMDAETGSGIGVAAPEAETSCGSPDGLPAGSVDAKRGRYVERLDADIACMERLVEVLLEFTRLDARLHEVDATRSVTPSATRLDLGALARRCCAEFDPGERLLGLECDAALPMIDAHETHVSMLLANLLQNARRFARVRVLVRVRVVAEGAALSVEDDGEGIAENERERLRRPFERGASGTGDAGHGLGLAIVERIALWHHATLSIGTSERLGGAHVRVVFPAAHARKP